MTHPYYTIIEYPNDDWEQFLERICLYDIFKDLIAKHGVNKAILKSFIKYIVWAYSKSSEMVLLGSDWEKNKRRIFDAAGFQPQEMLLNATVYLEDEVVLKTIQRWLDFQDDSTYTQMNVLKDLMIEMQLSANSDIVKSSGEIDYDQKYKNACYVKDLRKMIEDLEQELIQNDMKLKDGVQEVKTTYKKNKMTVGVESFSK